MAEAASQTAMVDGMTLDAEIEKTQRLCAELGETRAEVESRVTQICGRPMTLGKLLAALNEDSRLSDFRILSVFF